MDNYQIVTTSVLVLSCTTILSMAVASMLLNLTLPWLAYVISAVAGLVAFTLPRIAGAVVWVRNGLRSCFLVALRFARLLRLVGTLVYYLSTWLALVYFSSCCVLFTLHTVGRDEWWPIAFPIGCIVLRATYSRWKTSLLENSYLTYCLSYTTPKHRAEILRGKFQQSVFLSLPPMPHHTHGRAASDRTAATTFADSLGYSINGKKGFFYQKSAADNRHHRDGSRRSYWVKDLNVGEEGLYDCFGQSKVPEDSLFVLVDTDQYVEDMGKLLMRNHRPTLLYTFQPEAVGAVRDEYAYRFNENEVEYRVTGGGLFSHPVWNWSVDNLLISRTLYLIDIDVWFLPRLQWGGYKWNVSYLVDRQKTSVDHELIFLTPMGSWWGDKAFVGGEVIKGTNLVRLEPSNGKGFNHMYVHSKEGMFVSISKENGYLATTIPASVHEAICMTGDTSKYDLNAHTVASLIDSKENRVLALPVLAHYMVENSTPKPPVRCPVDDAIRTYQYNPYMHDPSAKSPITAFMSPIVDGAFVPTRCLSNEERAVQGRVIAVRPQELKKTAEMAKYMHEFVEKLIPESKAHTLVPQQWEQVYEQMNRPTQRALLDRTIMDLANWLTSQFMKGECYTKVSDPRIISTISTPDKRDYSYFIYAFAEGILKNQKWYAFGRKPKDIARRVTQVLLYSDMAVNTDFSRFDGHVSNLIREVEEMCLLRAFRPEHHDRVRELHQKQHHLIGMGTFGILFETLWARLSGSPETSAFNSVDNAFIAYVALRSTMRNGAYLEPEEAWNGLGIYGGDDGLTADVDVDRYKRAAEMFGQELVLDPVYRGALGIKFLARIYGPGVWTGDTNSMCDLLRQLSKWHGTANLPAGVTRVQKLLEKTRSAILCDRNTPILGKFLKRVEELNGGLIAVDKATERIRAWNSHYDEIDHYENTMADWMWVVAEQQMPTFNRNMFINFIERCRSLEDLLEAPICMAPVEVKTTIPVTTRDEVHPLNLPVPTAPAVYDFGDVKKSDAYKPHEERKRHSSDGKEAKEELKENKHETTTPSVGVKGDEKNTSESKSEPAVDLSIEEAKTEIEVKEHRGGSPKLNDNSCLPPMSPVDTKPVAFVEPLLSPSIAPAVSVTSPVAAVNVPAAQPLAPQPKLEWKNNDPRHVGETFEAYKARVSKFRVWSVERPPKRVTPSVPGTLHLASATAPGAGTNGASKTPSYKQGKSIASKYKIKAAPSEVGANHPNAKPGLAGPHLQLNQGNNEVHRSEFV